MFWWVLENKLWEWEEDETGSGLCSDKGFVTSTVEILGSVTRELIILAFTCMG